MAKLVEALFNTTYLSDVGCTFRVVSRERARDTVAHATVDGSAFGLEMMLLAVVRGARLVQVPVNYRPRVGRSAVTGDLAKTVALGLQMVAMVLRTRVRRGRYRR